MADTKHDGKDFLFYVKATAPSDLEDPTQYTQVMLLRNVSFSAALEMLDARDRNSSDGADDIPGDKSETISLEGNLPKDGNAGQNILQEAYRDRDKLYWLLTTNTVGDHGRYGRGYVESIEETHPDNAVASISVGLKVQGVSTLFEVTT